MRGSSVRPVTIPALREWQPAAASFVPGSPVRIVLAAGLSETAEVFVRDLRALGADVEVMVQSGPPARGEVHLRLEAADPGLGAEGYRLELGQAAVITANAAAGAFYGTRSLLQLLAQPEPVPAGVARDWPRYGERGLMVDIGRKHFDFGWLAARVRELAYLKLNRLHLHFTEDIGWRIESDRNPPLHAEQHLRKQQVRDLVALATRHHITVVPEIDLPGHMGAALAPHPEFQLRDASGTANPGKLDYTIGGARRFVTELIEEYLPLFPGHVWHTGADEFLAPADYARYPQLERYAKQTYGSDANAKDGVLGLLNEVNDLVRGHGKTLRMWGDGLGGGSAVSVDPSVDVEWWTDITPLSELVPVPTPRQVLDAGHRIHNASWYPTYYTNLATQEPPRPDLPGMYEKWRVHRFRGQRYVDGTVGAPYHDIDPATAANLGSTLHVWNDEPEQETAAEVARGIHQRLRVLAQHTWESPCLVPGYAEFEPLITRVGDAPGA